MVRGVSSGTSKTLADLTLTSTETDPASAGLSEATVLMPPRGPLCYRLVLLFHYSLRPVGPGTKILDQHFCSQERECGLCQVPERLGLNSYFGKNT